MTTAKEDIREMLDHLPDDASYDDIQYHIYVRQSIAAGLKDVEDDRTVSHADAMKQLKLRSDASEAAPANDVDVTLLQIMLALSPEERLLRMEKHARDVRQLLEYGRQIREASTP